MNDEGFWKNVKTLLKECNTKQEWLAEICNVPYRTLTNWISRDIIPDAILAVKIANALNVSVEYLVTGGKTKPEIMLEQIRAVLSA